MPRMKANESNVCLTRSTLNEEEIHQKEKDNLENRSTGNSMEKKSMNKKINSMEKKDKIWMQVVMMRTY